MPDEPSIGQNLARLRGQTGLTQQELADASGVSVATIRKLERDGRSTALMGTLAKLARALDVKPSALLGQPQALRQEDGERTASVAVLRRSIHALDEMPGVPVTVEEREGPALDELRRTVRILWQAYHDGRHALLIGGLPDLIGGAKAAVRSLRGEGAREAAADLSRGYQLAAHAAVHLAQDDLARSALDRAMLAADAAEDPLLVAAGCTGLSWVLLRQNEPELAARIAVAKAAELNPRVSPSDYPALRMWGRLMLCAVTAASRQEDHDGAKELLDETRRCTTVVRDDATDYTNGGNYAFFGPAKIDMIAVEVAVSQGRSGEALRLAKRVTPSRRVPPTGRSRHLLDVAQAQTWESQFTPAVSTLTRVREATPEWMRYQVLARVIVRQIVEGKGRRRIDGLLPLVEHLNGRTG
ncbi:helix-turn-helix transcriptional regulator [Streptomyces sp. NPDC002055]|uniref:helix-turn-helix domain-containing protein n=1 Tax=Streptomyces sp. NPDC002055 TaxID=3154534 RepID=UPI0033210B8D